MQTRLSVSEARERLPQILRALEHRPGRSFEILRRGKPNARHLADLAAGKAAPLERPEAARTKHAASTACSSIRESGIGSADSHPACRTR